MTQHLSPLPVLPLPGALLCALLAAGVLAAPVAVAQDAAEPEAELAEGPATQAQGSEAAGDPASQPAGSSPQVQAPEAPTEPTEPAEPTAQQLAWSWYELGLKSFKASRYAEAAIAFEAAYGLDREPALLFNAARSFQLDGQLAAARERYQRLVEAQGLDESTRRKAANALVQLGVTLMERDAAAASIEDEQAAAKAAADRAAEADKQQAAMAVLQSRLAELVRALPAREPTDAPFAPAAVDVAREAGALGNRGLVAYHAGEYDKASQAFDAWAALTDAPEAHRARLRVALRQGQLSKADGLLQRIAGRDDLPAWLQAELPFLMLRFEEARAAVAKREAADGLTAAVAERQGALASPELSGSERAEAISAAREVVAERRELILELHKRAVERRAAAQRAEEVLQKAHAAAAEGRDRAAADRLAEGLFDAGLDRAAAEALVAAQRVELLAEIEAARAAVDAAEASGNPAAIEDASGVLATAEAALEAADDAAGSDTDEPFSIFDKVLIQLNWGDDNLLIGAGETRESSPDPNFGRCARTSIDGITGRDCAQGQSRLGLYKQVEVGAGFNVAGALVLGLGVVTDPESSKAGSVSLYDLGSYLRLDKRFGDSRAHLYVEMYPVDARPLSAGFHRDIEWGTKDEFPKNFRRGAAPGVKVGFDSGAFYAYVGAKTALIKTPLEVELSSDIGNRILFSTRTFYGVLGGLGLHLDSLGLSIEANGGFFHKGTLTKEGVLGKDLLAGGGSLRVGYQLGMPIGLRIDSSLYERSASGAQTVEAPSYEGSFAFSTALEGTMRVQNLSDFERPGSTALEWAYAGHLGFKARFDALRLHVEARARTLSYITAEVPGFFPYSTTPRTAETTPEVQGLASVDYKLGDFTLAVTGGLRMPATYRGLPPQGSGTDAASGGVRTVVVSEADAGGWYILSAGRKARVVGWGELGVKWSPAREFSLMADVLYGRDENRTQVERDASGHALRVHTEPNIVGLNLLGQFLF